MRSDMTLQPSVDGTLPLELNDGEPIWLREPPELPVVTYDEEYAESIDTEGGRRVRSRPQNPEGRLTLLISETDDVGFWGVITALQQTVEQCRRHGGTLRYEPSNGTAVTYQLESIRLAGLPQDDVINRGIAQPDLEFTCRPYGHLDPIVVFSDYETSTDPQLELVVTNIPGSVDALGTLEVKDGAGENRDDIDIGGEHTYFDRLDPTSLLIDSADMETTGFAGTVVGATIEAVLTTSWVTVCALPDLPHVGSYRPKIRVALGDPGLDEGPIYMRLAYRTGDGVFTRTPAKRVPGTGDYYEIDVGAIKLAEMDVGAQIAELRIEAKSDTPDDEIGVDYLRMVPTEVVYGRAASPADVETTTANVFTARDEFNQTAGALHGKTAPVGGSWSTSGDATDFTVDATDHVAARSTVSGAAPRFAVLGGDQTDVGAAVGVKTIDSDADADVAMGLVVRYVDDDNYLVFQLTRPEPTGATGSLVLGMYLAGVRSDLWTGSWFAFPASATVYLAMSVSADGGWALSKNLVPVAYGQSADLATGGDLETGKVGIWDYTTATSSLGRQYDNFLVYVPTAETSLIRGTPSAFADQSLYLGPDSCWRESSDGTTAGRPQYTGRYLKLPPSGREGKACRLVTSGRRLDRENFPDTGIDDELQAKLTIQPRVALL